MALRIGAQVLDGPSEEILVLPRSNGELVITARAVQSMEDFDRFVPEPKAKMGWAKGKGTIPLTKDPQFKQQMESYGNKRFAFMALKSLEPSDIEWQTVDLHKPDTWDNWMDELKENGLSEFEVNRIIQLIMQANALDEAKLKEARETFLRGLEAATEKSCGHLEELPNTPSGPPASDGE